MYVYRFSRRSHDAHDPEIQEQNDPSAGGRVRDDRGTGHRSVGHVLRASVAIRARGPGDRAGVRRSGPRRVQTVLRPVRCRVPHGGRGVRQTERRRRRRTAVRRRLRPVSGRQGVRDQTVRRRAVHAGQGHIQDVRRHRRTRTRTQVSIHTHVEF